ncbi:hypothetical protein P3T73_01130 [Kiritimatiellota bacterium B12222]|nr:hypothetical protein P3T73_01130 [Kiritimatiellota bacterium B12222]
MKILYFIFSIVVIPPCLAINLDLFKDNLTVHLEVVDVDGNPLPGAKLELYFTHTGLQRQVSGDRTKVFKREFDGEEEVTIKYKSYKSIGIRAKKEGYWLTGFRYNFTQKDRIDGETDGSPNGHYQKEFTIVLRKKKNPRSLFVHRLANVEAPGLGKPYGFDLEKGDWVTPHGKGVTSDFIFQINRKAGEEPPAYFSEIIWTFSNPDDGLIHVEDSDVPGSKLHLGGWAPVEGYIGRYTREVGVRKKGAKFFPISDPPLSKIEAIEGCWFRIRSQKNEQGELEGQYGKMIGTVKYSTRGDKKPWISFIYYLSPDNLRSLEWNGESLVPNADLQSVKKR